MIWLTKTYPFGAEWAADQTTFADLMIRVAADGTGSYDKMLMIIARDDGAVVPDFEQVYISLPSEAYVKLFPGYTLAGGPPEKAATLLGGGQLEFERLFRFHSPLK